MFHKGMKEIAFDTPHNIAEIPAKHTETRPPLWKLVKSKEIFVTPDVRVLTANITTKTEISLLCYKEKLYVVNTLQHPDTKSHP
jgi:hypothetical protein